LPSSPLLSQIARAARSAGKYGPIDTVVHQFQNSHTTDWIEVKHDTRGTKQVEYHGRSIGNGSGLNQTRGVVDA
jgi:hypothetical protein